MNWFKTNKQSYIESFQEEEASDESAESRFTLEQVRDQTNYFMRQAEFRQRRLEEAKRVGKKVDIYLTRRIDKLYESNLTKIIGAALIVVSCVLLIHAKTLHKIGKFAKILPPKWQEMVEVLFIIAVLALGITILVISLTK